jgi:hypothetical protein
MRKRWALLAPAVGAAIACQLTLAGTVATAAPTAKTVSTVKTTATTSVPPNPVSEVDCNGYSPKYKSVRKLGANCTDPIATAVGKKSWRFYDNGRYVGHDEPSVKFLSNARGSGNTMSYLMRVPVDPAKSPTSTGSVTDYGQLSVAPWFGLPICDSKSFPQNPCMPDSDTNLGVAGNPNDAGSAFLELQFYPPGYTPFIDSESCSATQWCAALTIDSLECTASGQCNNNCIEPVNFSFLQTNGVPAGPPSPQLTNASTFLGNQHTLKINPGDALAVSITDPAAGLTTTVRDLTTGQTGWITASAANGFMNTSIADCSGTPYTFHAEYNTAKDQNRVPWAALEGGVLMEQEIGHSEVCSSLANQAPYSATYPGGQSYSDPSTFDTCVGGSEGANSTGENAADFATARTQGPNGPQACPTQGDLCEYGDGFCFNKGTRTALVNGVPTTEFSAATQCFDNRDQNGDLDFEGLDYQAIAWPDGSSNHPTSVEYVGPFDGSGHSYPQVRFETDAAGSEFLCNTATGAGCKAPPIGSDFYPYWTLSRTSHGSFGFQASACEWNFGKTLPKTIQDFGGDVQYGHPDLAWFGGTLISNPLPNPEFNRGCIRF